MRKGTIKRPEGATEPIIRLVGNPDPHRVAENNERVEIPTYDEKAAILEVLEASSFLVTTDWQWTPDGKRLQNTPSLFFLRVWCKNPESLRQQGFEVCGARDGAADVWWVYLRPGESLRGYVSMEY